MTYLDPHQQLRKVCPVCGKEFVTTAYYNKIYDTVKCYRRAKNKRRLDREEPVIPKVIDEQHEQLIEATRFFAVVHSPTPKQLEDYTKTILLELNDNKPIRITGTIPDWKPPKGVKLVEQYGTNPKEWLLVAHEPSLLDELLH